MAIAPRSRPAAAAALVPGLAVAALGVGIAMAWYTGQTPASLLCCALAPQTLWLIACVFIASALSSATGISLSLIAGPVLLVVFPAPEAVALIAFGSLIGQLFGIALLRGSIAYKIRLPLIMAGLVGVPLGTLLLICCDAHLTRVCLGGLILGSGLWSSIQRTSPYRKPISCLYEALVGLIGGVTGGLAGASSLVPEIWYSARGLDKERRRAVSQPYAIAIQLASIASLWLQGIPEASFTPVAYFLVLPLLAGVGIGIAGFRMASSVVLTRAALSVAGASGLGLLLLP